MLIGIGTFNCLQSHPKGVGISNFRWGEGFDFDEVFRSISWIYKWKILILANKGTVISDCESYMLK